MDLFFSDGKGDYTKPRLRANPTLADYFLLFSGGKAMCFAATIQARASSLGMLGECFFKVMVTQHVYLLDLYIFQCCPTI